MKNTIIIILISFKSFSQSFIIEPQGINSKSNDTLKQLEITNCGGTAKIKTGTAGGIASMPSIPNSNTPILRLEGGGYNGNQFVVGANINFVATENWNNLSRGTNINFKTKANNNGTNQDRMTLNKFGDLGIGTTDPKAKLHVFEGASGRIIPFTTTAIIESNQSAAITLSDNNLFKEADLSLKMKNINISNLEISKRRDYLGISYAFQLFDDGTKNCVSFGINAPCRAKLTLGKDLALKKTAYLSGTANFTNFDRQAASRILVTGLSSDMTGIANGFEGLLMYISVDQGTTLRIFNENSNSLPQNRIITHTGGTVAITSSGGGATLLYDGVAQRWRIIGIAQ
jgi:hypothetical protein